ncbi:hypothetical protein ACFQH6_16040 [Halobacteriaceae archaeon GCM10025711]
MTETSDAADRRRQVQAAVREVRREGAKAAVIYATVDAVLVVLVVNLVLQVLDVQFQSVAGVDGPTLAAVVAGLAAFVVEVTVRLRRPLVEQFEAANPSVREALRTARDAAASGEETTMAGRLYDDVIERLRDTSSLGLVSGRRLAATVVVILVVSLLTVQATVADVDVHDFDVPGISPGPADRPQSGGGTGTGEGSGAGERGYEGLQPGGDILGDPENVTPGSVNVTATLVTGGPGEGNGETRTYESSGLSAGDDAVDAQEAGFEPPPEFEDADIIREYNVRIRQGADDQEADDDE